MADYNLKPCPFCGVSKDLCVQVSAKGLAVKCKNCGTIGPIAKRAKNDDHEYESAYAQEYWNLRQMDATQYWNMRA